MQQAYADRRAVEGKEGSQPPGLDSYAEGLQTTLLSDILDQRKRRNQPIIEWAERRGEAMRRAYLIREARADPRRSMAVLQEQMGPRMGPVAWRKPPPPQSSSRANLTGSHSAAGLLERSFRTPGPPRPYPALRSAPSPLGAQRLRNEGSMSHQELHGEMQKTAKLLTGAKESLVLEREVAQAAKAEAVQANGLLHQYDGRVEAMRAELERELAQREHAAAAERARLAGNLSDQRGELEVEMARVQADVAQRLEWQQQQQRALEGERDELKQQVAALQREQTLLRSQLLKATAAHQDTLDRRRMDQQAAMREAHITQLHRMAARRLAKQELSRGFNTWQTKYLEALHRRQLLRRAATTLHSRHAVAFVYWKEDYEARLQQGTLSQLEQELSRERQLRVVAEQELEHTAARFASETEDRVRVAIEAHQAAVEENVRREDEAKLMRLHEQALRRIGQLGTTRAFNAWAEQWRERHRSRRLLQHAGARLHRPQLAARFFDWWRVWDEVIVARRAAERVEELREVEVEKAQLRQKLLDDDELALAAKANVQAQVVALQAELGEAREAMAAGHGQEVELRRKMEERLQEEKRRRVEHLQALGVRRLLHAALARGWTAWCRMWTERVRKRNLLKHAGMRLMRPRVVTAYRLWLRDFEIEHAAASKRTTVQELRKEVAHRQRVQAEVAELLKALGNAGQAVLDERARSIGHLQRMSLHRMMHGALTRAWATWLELASRRQRQQRLIRQAIGRLARPKLMAVYQAWMTDWSDAEAARRGARLLEERSAATSAAEMIMALQAELGEARGAMAAGRGQEVELRRRMEEELSREKELRVEHLKQIATRRILRGALARGWSAWQGQWEEDRRIGRLMARASACLVRPHLSATYSWWRREWEVASALRRQQELLGEEGAQVHAEAQARLIEEAVSARVAEEVALRKSAEEALEQRRVEFEELDAAQNVALVEARKAATDALGRSSTEVEAALHSSLSSMEKELKRARVAEKAATAAAKRSSDLLYEHQLRAEEKLNRMLEEHRCRARDLHAHVPLSHPVLRTPPFPPRCNHQNAGPL